MLAPLSEAEPGARVNTSGSAEIMGVEKPLQKYSEKQSGAEEGTGYILGLCHYLSPEAGPLSTGPQIPSCEMWGLD